MSHATQRKQGIRDERAEAQEKALERFLELAQRPGSDYNLPWGSRLVFTETGKARLAHYAGMLFGMTSFGEKQNDLEALAQCGGDEIPLRERALHLALELDKRLSYLGEYGGTTEYEVDDGRQTIEVPSYKIVLNDDGYYGFSIAWYRPYTWDQVRTKGKELDEAAYKGQEADGTEIPDAEQTCRWDAALAMAKEKLRISKDLEESRYYIPQWVREEEARYLKKHHEHSEDDFFRSCKVCAVPQYALSGNYKFFHYGFSHNGGLILHGLGRDVNPTWGVHT